MSEAVGRSEGTGGGRGVEGLFVVCLFEWTPSEKNEYIVSILDHATNRLFLDQLFFDQLTKLFTRVRQG